MPSSRGTRGGRSPRQVIIAYVPALHSGYRYLFDKYRDAKIYVLDGDVIAQFDELRKDLRALKPTEAVEAISGWDRSAELASQDGLREIAADTEVEVIMPDEDVSRALAKSCFAASNVSFEPIFLRWDRRRMEAEQDVATDTIVSTDDLSKRMMQHAAEEAEKSANFWRRVGAVIARDGKVILKSSNRTQPSPSANWTDGDPRINAHRGISIDLTNDMHAEALLVAQAARKGLSLEGAQIYVTVFPCPTCAKLIASSGISELYFAQGYAILDGEEVLNANGVKLIQVKQPAISKDKSVWAPYPEKSK